MSQINSSFGSGGMSLALNEMQFGAFIQHLKTQCRTQTFPMKKAACVIGLQPCKQVWVLGDNIQVGAPV